MRQAKPADRKPQTKTYLVQGPNGSTWSVWDFGDEMTIHDGRSLTDTVVARVSESMARRLTSGERFDHVRRAASAIHTARLLGADSLAGLLGGLWR